MFEEEHEPRNDDDYYHIMTCITMTLTKQIFQQDFLDFTTPLEAKHGPLHLPVDSS